MSQLRAAGAIAAALSTLALVTAGCGSEGSHLSGPPGEGSGGGKGGAPSGPVLGNLGGTSSSSAGSSGVTAPTTECAADVVEAKRIPLDMYVMLDISSSMLQPTEGDPSQSKWQAVSSALADFVSDGASAGIGVGLQVFPLPDPAAPTECTTDQQCAEFGPCLTKACWPLVQGQLQLCVDDTDCARQQSCVEYGLCANDQGYACDRDVVTKCSGALGACEIPPSTCLVTADCRPARYAAPAAPIALLPGARAGLLAVLNAAVPDGFTPSGPALEGAIDQASSWAQAHVDHQVVAVLATDGLPTLEQQGNACAAVNMQSQVDAVAALAATGFAGTPPIATFVIGVFGSQEVGGPKTVDAIAKSGGTSKAFIVDTAGDVAQQFRDALNAIRASRLSCELLVPEAETGKKLDFKKVNVVFDDGSGPTDLAYVGDKAECQAAGGWYYDVNPDPPVSGTPTRIVACPTTCTAFGEVDTGSVAIKLGCATNTQVPK